MVICVRLLVFGALCSLAFVLTTSEKEHMPSFAFSWLDERDTFQAGDVATIMIKVFGEFHLHGNSSLDRSAFNPTLTINGKMGNNSIVSGVLLHTSEDINDWRIQFVPLVVGVFDVILSDESFKIFDSSLHFNVMAGRLYPSVCSVSWLGLVNEYIAGEKAALLITPRDAFGNIISRTREGSLFSNFTLTMTSVNDSLSSIMPNITHMGWNEVGYIIIEFLVVKAGNLFLHVEGGNQTLIGSPLPFKVNPGSLNIPNCLVKWRVETLVWQIFSKMEIFIHQQDKYGNIVPGFYEFDADVIDKETNLSVPISDLQFEGILPGIQLFSFSLLEPGSFLLTISDPKNNAKISNMPYSYSVFTGYCDGSASILNGSGLNSSVAGETKEFSIYLNDFFQYPSFVEAEAIRVQMLRLPDASYYVQPTIDPIVNGNGFIRGLNHDTISQKESSQAPSVRPSNSSDSKVFASAFSVIYTAEKSGIYEIYAFCGNVLLNGGLPIRKEVRAGEVNMSLSGVAKFSPKVPKLIENELVLQLRDSFSNPVLSQQSRLKLEIASVNKSDFSSGVFVDNHDGSYTVFFLAKDVGTYEMCFSFDEQHFLPCPFGVNVYGGDYFPRAYDDNVSVWEDESLAFDVLNNDYFAGVNASILEFSKPSHGSLLQYGPIFRYTPYKGYFGTDAFGYTILDVNLNLASAAVSIAVLKAPPQFISLPTQLQATEDAISPKYGGFSGFEIGYSDVMENISVAFSARSGSMLLSPMLMQFGKPIWDDYFAHEADNLTNGFALQGHVKGINLALQSVQYLGKDNFNGDDVIRVSAGNDNGKNEFDVPIFVEPINDPPFINVPKHIVLKNNPGSLIFDKARDNFEFSVGDPDLVNFPGGESNFIVSFSIEVNDGFLIASLPAKLINTTELKLVNRGHQWHPLQTYVTISDHFVVKAKGFKFRGTVNDCNSVMQQLSYLGGEEGSLLLVKLNDLGHYGRHFDGAEKISWPLFAEAATFLSRKQPMDSVVARTLVSIIIIEFVLMFFSGALLLFFTCKCSFILINERGNSHPRDDEPSDIQVQHFMDAPWNSDLSDSENSYRVGSCSNPASTQFQPSKCWLCSYCEDIAIEASAVDSAGDAEPRSDHHVLPVSFMPPSLEEQVQV